MRGKEPTDSNGNGDELKPTPPSTEILQSVEKLTHDLRNSSKLIGRDQIRMLVRAYYIVQDQRIRTHNQVEALTKGGKPTDVLVFFDTQFARLENEVFKVLDTYSYAQDIGQWMRAHLGVGPVISAGLIAHIDINIAETSGDIWRFAGYDPTLKWLGTDAAKKLVREVMGPDKKGQLDEDDIKAIAAASNFSVSFIMTMLKDDPPTITNVNKAMAKRPWNADLKRLCWLLGESFTKVSGNENAYYGAVYAKRKVQEVRKNKAGDFADQAAKSLREKNYGKATVAYKCYTKGLLPPARIHLRAQRYAVKLFLAHMHDTWRRLEGLEVPTPYPIAMLDGHSHYIPLPAGS